MPDGGTTVAGAGGRGPGAEVSAPAGGQVMWGLRTPARTARSGPRGGEAPGRLQQRDDTLWLTLQL